MKIIILALVAGALFFGPPILLVASLCTVVVMGFLGLLLALLTVFI